MFKDLSNGCLLKKETPSELDRQMIGSFLLIPEAIIIGGGVSKAGDLLFKPLQEKLFAQIGKPFKDHLQILPAHFGNEAGMIGAANLALEQVTEEGCQIS